MSPSAQETRPGSKLAPTRQRILDAALELFSERGFTGTSVGDVEIAAGLAPRSGALYKHFPSKRDLLEAAFEERMEAIAEFRARVELTDLGDPRAELTLIGRWGLAELRRERRLVRMVMKDGDRVPAIAEAFRDAIVLPGLALSTDVISRHGRSGLTDPEATAAALCAALVGFSLQGALFGDDAAGVDDDRLVRAWVELAMSAIKQDGGSGANG